MPQTRKFIVVVNGKIQKRCSQHYSVVERQEILNSIIASSQLEHYSLPTLAKQYNVTPMTLRAWLIKANLIKSKVRFIKNPVSKAQLLENRKARRNRRDAIKHALEKGTLSISRIASQYKVTLATVYSYKKRLGLTLKYNPRQKAKAVTALKKIYEFKDSSKTLLQISERLNVSTYFLYQLRQQLGFSKLRSVVPKSYKLQDRRDALQVVKLKRETHSLKAIAKELNMPERTLRYWISSNLK